RGVICAVAFDVAGDLLAPIAMVHGAAGPGRFFGHGAAAGDLAGVHQARPLAQANISSSKASDAAPETPGVRMSKGAPSPVPVTPPASSSTIAAGARSQG